MWSAVVKLGSGLVVTLVMIGFVFVAGMRRKSPTVLTAVRRFNHRVGNPLQMKTAGSPGAYASLVRHVGRVSGQPYETPVVAEATADGFVIGLPYGSQADWVKNVVAAGSATIVHEGMASRVTEPEVVPAALFEHYFSPKAQRSMRRFHVDQCLHLRRVDGDDAASPAAGQTAAAPAAP